jgi:N-acetylglucosaminyldiphosphoundecaprenol N-acetyl-beta-D-mannosaminyltransferase
MNKAFSSMLCMGYPVFTDSLDLLQPQRKTLVNTINQYSYCMAEKDPGFKESLMGSDILIPDGVGIVAAYRLLKGRKINKIAGADLHIHLLEKLNKTGGTCFYLGSSARTLQKIKERISIDFPLVKVEVYSPPFKPEFSGEENNQMITAVNAFRPDVLFVGMTAPKQEKWAYAHKAQLEAKIICSIGAVFDFYAGTIERPNELWINLGLEWFGRLVKEPKRMWKRYLYYGPVFGYYIAKEKIKQYVPPQKEYPQ